MAGIPTRAWYHNGDTYVRAVVVHRYDDYTVDLFAPTSGNDVKAFHGVPQVDGPDAPEAGGNTYYVEE